jgi:hypothetical protein
MTLLRQRHRIPRLSLRLRGFRRHKKARSEFLPGRATKATKLTKWGYVKVNLGFSDISDNKDSYKLLRLRSFPAKIRGVIDRPLAKLPTRSVVVQFGSRSLTSLP